MPEPAGCEMAPGLCARMETFRWAQAYHSFLGPLPPMSLSLQWAIANCDSPGDAPGPRGKSNPVSCGVTALCWVPAHANSHVCPSRVECFSQSLWTSCPQALLVLKAKYSGIFSSRCQTPRLGRLMCGSELSLWWENLYDIINFKFLRCPPSGCGTWLHHENASAAVSLWLLLCFWM